MNNKKRIVVVKGMFYGDEGKGRAVQWFYGNRPKDSKCAVVKANGNSNAAHHVRLDDGSFWRYSQLNSASHLGAPTIYHPDFLIDLFGLWMEVKNFHAKFGFYPKLYICRQNFVTTPIDVEKSQLRNSCCRSGLAETRQNILDGIAPNIYNVTSGDLSWHIYRQLENHDSYYKIDQLCASLFSIIDFLEKNCSVVYYNSGDLSHELDYIIVECAQGVQLDQDLWPEKPFTTWSHTKGDNKYLDKIGFKFSLDDKVEIEHVGVMRWYLTRHGDGPFKTWNQEPFVRSKEEQNKLNDGQGEFRYGAMDWNLFDKSMNAAQVDSIFLTHYDTIPTEEMKTIFINHILFGDVVRKLYLATLDEVHTL